VTTTSKPVEEMTVEELVAEATRLLLWLAERAEA